MALILVFIGLLIIGAVILLIGTDSAKPTDYDPNAGYFETKFSTKIVQAHTENIDAHIGKSRSKIVLDNMPYEAEAGRYTGLAAIEGGKAILAENVNRQKVAEIAGMLGMNALEASQLLKELYLLKGQKALEWEDTTQQIKAAVAAGKLGYLQEIASLQGNIDNLISDINRLYEDKPNGWEDMVQDRVNTLNALRSAKDGKERLLQADNRENTGGADKDTNSGGDLR